MILTKEGASDYIRNLTPIKSSYDTINKQAEQYMNSLYAGYNQSSQALSRGYGTDRAQVGMNFSQSMSDVIKNAAASRANLMSASGNIGTGALTQQSSDLERAVSGAYNSYIQNRQADVAGLNQNLAANQSTLMSNLLSGAQEIESNAQTAKSKVDTLVNEQATNYSNLYNSGMEYLQYLADEGLIDYSNPEFGRYFDVTYEDGTPTGSLRTDAWFEANFYDRDKQGNIIGLSDTGKDFYRQILYGTSDIANIPSYEKWLQENNKELYDWSTLGSYDSKYGRNLEAVFGEAGIDVNNHKYAYGSDYNAGKYTRGTDPTASYLDSNDFGDIKRWDTQSGATLDYFGSMSFTGMNVEDIFTDNKTEDFNGVYGESKYKFRVKKDAEVADNDVVNDIYKSTDKIEDGKLYAYTKGDTKKLYLSHVDESGNVTLKEVTIRSDVDDFWNKLKNDEGLKYTYKQYKEDEWKKDVETTKKWQWLIDMANSATTSGGAI